MTSTALPSWVEAGCWVRITGLAKAPQHNGKVGKVSAKAAQDGRVRVLDPAPLATVQEWPAHDLEVWTAKAVGGSLVLSGADDMLLKAWDIREPPSDPSPRTAIHSNLKGVGQIVLVAKSGKLISKAFASWSTAIEYNVWNLDCV